MKFIIGIEDICHKINIVTKRFARALALPDIGPKDGFLCYLPLYHTFGRWFEMIGALFWGATYTFTENTSFKTLLRDFKLAKPSIFISIPKRWIRIQEHIVSSISLERSTDEEIRSTTNLITGGKLKWGLSAAGFLDPDIFKFFNENKISLLSGYGMTEATGGITMTPPEDYIANSVGKSLPGINLKLAKIHYALFVETSPGPVKFAAELLDLCLSDTRLPLSPIKETTKNLVRNSMIEAGLISQ